MSFIGEGKRIPLDERELPDYTKGEEITNMVTHIIGGALGVAALVLCVVFSAIHHNPWAVVSSCIYGASLITLYTMSSVYHGLHPNKGKKVLQVLDHCTIFFLIAGTYTPVLLVSVRSKYPGWGWALFGVVWGLSALGVVFTAIDLEKYKKFSMLCYVGIGWVIVIALKPVIETIGWGGFFWILGGGICYTIGAVLYSKGKTVRYMHSIFHVFVVAASVLQFFGIFFHVI